MSDPATYVRAQESVSFLFVFNGLKKLRLIDPPKRHEILYKMRRFACDSVSSTTLNVLNRDNIAQVFPSISENCWQIINKSTLWRHPLVLSSICTTILGRLFMGPRALLALLTNFALVAGVSDGDGPYESDDTDI